MQCIDENYVCDNEKNCFDFSDEICNNMSAISDVYIQSRFSYCLFFFCYSFSI